MKKLIFLFIVLTNFSFAQTWSTVGSPNFANEQANGICVSISLNGEPYVVYRDSDQTSTGTVKKFDGSSWGDVGTRFSSGYISSTTIAFDTYGKPYIAYTDWANGGKATVIKFDENSWVAIGDVNFTPSDATYISFALDTNDTPYVAFRDFANSYRASVMKFNGTNWVYVGTPGFSSNDSFGGVADVSFAIDANGTPYISYVDHSPTYKATVMKYDGTNWVNVGPGIISAGQSGYTSIVIDSQGAPYVAFEDGANGGKATVMKFDGSNWIPVGVAGFSPGVAEYTSLAIGSNDVLYLAFRDYANSKKATVMTFNDSNWVIVGNAGFSASDAMFTTIAVDNNNGILYAAYEVVYNDVFGSTLPTTYNATVMKYAIITEINDLKNCYSLNVFPNPTNRIISISISSANPKETFILKVSDSLGKTVYSENLKEITSAYTKQIDLSFLPNGIYFIELQSSSPDSSQKKRELKKIVLQ